MLVVLRYTVPPEGADGFLADAEAALTALAARPGFVRARAGSAIDDPTQWVLTLEWENVGAYRRALTAFDVRVAAQPLMAAAHNEATAFEPRVVVDGAVPALARGSDRARPRGVDRSADG